MPIATSGAAHPRRSPLSFGVYAMTASDVQSIVLTEIGNDWSETNAHGVDLQSCLVQPHRIPVIWRTVQDGQVVEDTRQVWLVLEEEPVTKHGYKIVFDDNQKMFGLASPGYASDPHACLVGYYGDFWTTFKGM